MLFYCFVKLLRLFYVVHGVTEPVAPSFLDSDFHVKLAGQLFVYCSDSYFFTVIFLPQKVLQPIRRIFALSSSNQIRRCRLTIVRNAFRVAMGHG